VGTTDEKLIPKRWCRPEKVGRIRCDRCPEIDIGKRGKSHSASVNLAPAPLLAHTGDAVLTKGEALAKLRTGRDDMRTQHT
jgi:hypothetical protein